MTTNNSVNTSLSGQTGTGSFVGSASPTFTGTPILGTPSATSLTFTSTSGIIGTTTNNNAAAGSVGQLISSVIPTGSPVSINSSQATDLTSISLTAGDWDVFGNISFNVSGGAWSLGVVWISATSATLPDQSLQNIIVLSLTASATTYSANAPYFRASLAGTTTIYLTGQLNYSAGTTAMFGGIYARRVR